MLTLKISKDGQAISDYEVTKYILAKLAESADNDVEAHVSTLMCLTYVQLLVAEGVVEPDKLKILYFDAEIVINDDGSLCNEPADMWLAYKIHLKLINQFMAKTKDEDLV